jgi:FlaA1/EpsC-like NDP-sugar epimerase
VGRLKHPVYRHRLSQIAADAMLVAAAYYLAFRLRFLDAPGGIPDRYDHMLANSIGFVVVGQLIVFYAFGLYEKWWRYFRLPDMIAVLRACAVSTAILAIAFLLLKPFHDQIPRSVVVSYFLLTVFLVGGARLLARMLLVERMARREVRGARRVLVVGAGSGGQMVVREMQLNPNLGSRAIGFLDDDPRKRGMRLHGINVVGTTEEVGDVLDEFNPDEVIIAIPSAPGELRGRVVTACRERDVPVRTLPTVFELLRGGVQLTRQLREVQVEDVLGREPVKMELDRVGAYVQDKVVLVTGAGGSIGSELCRQIAALGAERIILVDHTENALVDIERELGYERRFNATIPVLADVKNRAKMRKTFERFRPTVVFHAAAYKHVPLMEANPVESVRNNIFGMGVVADVASEFGCKRFVLVSTDKAVNPKNVLGQTKAVCEWIAEAAAAREHNGTQFISVRFGNVLGSSGSVIPLFRRQIARGGPVTVTNPEMTRYFMTIPEAVQLIIQAGAIGESGEIYVLDMGEPVKIIDLAHNMIRLSGKEPDVDIQVEFIGVRPGEKLHEELWAREEDALPTTHPKILRCATRPVDPSWLEDELADLERLVDAGETLEVVNRLGMMVRAPRRVEAEAATPEPA